MKRKQIKLTSFDELFESNNNIVIEDFDNDQNYTLAKKMIKDEIKNLFESMKRSYVALGYYFRGIEESQAFRKDGYNSLNEFAKTEYNLSASVVSRTININKMFSKDGYSPEIEEKYLAFSNSQLQELLVMDSDAVRQEVDNQTIRPDMPVKKIREHVKAKKSKKEENQPVIDTGHDLVVEPELEETIPNEDNCPRQITIETWDDGKYLPGKTVSDTDSEKKKKESEIEINTVRVDECECVYCRYIWDGRKACNADMDTSTVTCPSCGRIMGVSLSVEYLCYAID